MLFEVKNVVSYKFDDGIYYDVFVDRSDLLISNIVDFTDILGYFTLK